MKKIIPLITLLLSFIANVEAQNSGIPNGFKLDDGGAAIISEVVSVQNKAKTELYQDALIWIKDCDTNKRCRIGACYVEINNSC